MSKAQQAIAAAKQWLADAPARAIRQAYEAALEVKQLEDDYFNGNPVSEQAGYSENTYTYFRNELDRCLKLIERKLASYRFAAKLPWTSNKTAVNGSAQLAGQIDPEQPHTSVLEQLTFIDFILEKYDTATAQIKCSSIKSSIRAEMAQGDRNATNTTAPRLKGKPGQTQSSSPTQTRQIRAANPPDSVQNGLEDEDREKERSIIPGSFLDSFNRVRANLFDYQGFEKEEVTEMRQYRRRTITAFWFILILIITTVSTQQLTKNLIFNQLVRYDNPTFSYLERVIKPKGKLNTLENQGSVFRSQELEDEAFALFRKAKEEIEFKKIIGAYQITPQEEEELLKQEADRILDYYNDLSLEGIRNFFADTCAFFVFYALIYIRRDQLIVIKKFLDDTLYGLSDNAKAFLIIVATDTFVGYHSSDGWEALLGVLLQHFSIPENKTFLLTFIATVPVFLDGLFKFWIFQYLRQASPSTSAIYREMDG
ncbi:CemA family protein [Thalassoporum mexicanum PCC 7367]|uniref:hypothetical protein n=1 Tax=Thalassoporum mexicanum TaxID=3457544 RepID=UPI00029FDB4B|nr:hypothetical protein [Pseudanabaena sp. PCC 7367]AFY68494.1 CemA family protein [Pseudanabaena sp. PCC 7367]